MKKIFYVLCSLFIMIGCIFNIMPVKANSIQVNVTLINPAIKANFYKDNVLERVSTIGYIQSNGEMAYCVEPYKRLSSGDILVESSLLSEEQKQQISIISYNGYNQSDRKSDKWYAATQIMIWEALGTYAQLEGFDDYSQYRQKILERIDQFSKLPSFNNAKITLKKGEKQIVSDQNQVLPLFSQLSNTGNITIERNQFDLGLLSNSNQYAEGYITYQKFANQDLGLPIIYRSSTDDSVQSIIFPKITENVEGKLVYRVQPYGKVQFAKSGNQLIGANPVESEDGLLYQLQYGDETLNDVKANVYAREDIYDVWGSLLYAKDSLIEGLISGSNALSKQLPAGKYYLKEMETKPGYVLNEQEYDFVIANDKEDFDIVSVALNNQRAKVNIHMQKVFEEGSLLDISEAYQDVVMGIYTKNDIKTLDGKLIVKANSMVYRSGINADGQLKETADLPLGDYYLKELHTNEHFILDENTYEFSVNDNGSEIINVRINDGVIINQLHRNKLSIYKVDEKKTPLQAKFVLYDAKMNEISEFMTDENGVYEFADLVDGTYFIQEIEAPEGYKLNSKLHKLTFNEDFSYTIKNKKNVVNLSIETNDNGNHKTFEYSMLGSMIAMYGFVFRKLRLS